MLLSKQMASILKCNIAAILIITTSTVFLYSSEDSTSSDKRLNLSSDIQSRELLLYAQQILRLHGLDFVATLQKPLQFEDVGVEEWTKGLILITAGIILLPTPLRNWGIKLILLGIGSISWDYYEEIVHYLVQNDYITDAFIIDEIVGSK